MATKLTKINGVGEMGDLKLVSFKRLLAQIQFTMQAIIENNHRKPFAHNVLSFARDNFLCLNVNS